MSGFGVRRGGGAAGRGTAASSPSDERQHRPARNPSHRPSDRGARSSRGRGRRSGPAGGRQPRGRRGSAATKESTDGSPPLRFPMELPPPGEPLDAAEDSSNMCELCYQPMRTFVVANCSHSSAICGSCLVRLHITKKSAAARHQQRFPDQRKKSLGPPVCPLCKVDWNVAIVTDQRNLVESLKRQCVEDPDALQEDGSLEFRNRKLVYDEEIQAYFTGPQLKEYFSVLRSLRCLHCIHKGGKSAPKKAQTFKNLQSLNSHLMKQHKLRYCTACFETLDLFLHERELFTHAQFRHHCNYGSARTRISPQVDPHPFCTFCDIPLYSADELWVHLTSRHARCILCHNEGRRDEYFRNHDVLMRHLQHSHFVCQHPNCQEVLEAGIRQDEMVASVVFLSLFSLQVHEAEVHPSQGSKGRNRRVMIPREQPRKDPSDHGVHPRDFTIFRGFEYYEGLSEDLAAAGPGDRDRRVRGRGPRGPPGDGAGSEESSGEEGERELSIPSQQQARRGRRDRGEADSGMSAIRARAMAANVERDEEEELLRIQEEQAAEEEAAAKAAAEAIRELRLNEELEFPSLAPSAGDDPPPLLHQQQPVSYSEQASRVSSRDLSGDSAFPGIPGQRAPISAAGARAYGNRPVTGLQDPGAFPSLPQSSGAESSPGGSAAPTWEAHRKKLQSRGKVLEQRRRQRQRQELEAQARERLLKQSRRQERERLESEDFVAVYDEEARFVRNPELGLASHGFEGSSKIRTISSLPSVAADAAGGGEKGSRQPQEAPADFTFPSLQSGPTVVQEPTWPRSGSRSSKLKATAKPEIRVQPPSQPRRQILKAAPMKRQTILDTEETIDRLAGEGPMRYIGYLRTLRSLLLATADLVGVRLGKFEEEEAHHLSHELNRHLLREARRTTLQSLFQFDSLMYFGVRSDHVVILNRFLGNLTIPKDPARQAGLLETLPGLVQVATQELMDEELVVLYYWWAALLQFHLRGGDAEGIREMRRREARAVRQEQRNREREELQEASRPDGAPGGSGGSKKASKKKKKPKKDNKVLFRFGGR